jgi:hypothetical protein
MKITGGAVKGFLNSSVIRMALAHARANITSVFLFGKGNVNYIGPTPAVTNLNLDGNFQKAAIPDQG